MYEERYHWTVLRALSVLVAAALPVVDFCYLDGTRFYYVAVICGAYVLNSVAATHRVAFRAGPQGLTLGGNPLRRQRLTDFWDWSEVGRIAIFSRKSAPQPPRTRWERLSRQDRVAVFGPSPDPTQPEIRITNTMWRLDVDRLQSAVAELAPQVAVVDVRPGSLHAVRTAFWPDRQFQVNPAQPAEPVKPAEPAEAAGPPASPESVSG